MPMSICLAFSRGLAYYFSMMYDAIKSFPAQFGFVPEIENKENLGVYEQCVVLGMGGSNLAPGLLKIRKPELNIVSHRDYGLPHIPDAAKDTTLVIASSYSGNTEETIDGFEEAGRCRIHRAAVSAGGRLRDLARAAGAPYIQLPDTGIQPRSAAGISIVGLTALLRESDAMAELRAVGGWLSARMDFFEREGKALAEKMSGRMPMIYASRRNRAVAYNWKIKMNETGKVPAFYNVFPELNHNEMTGFDAVDATRALSEKMFFIFLEDDADHPKTRKRMAITAALYRERGLPSAAVKAAGEKPFEKIFASTLIADWTAYYTSQLYGTESELVPMVEDFKKRIA